MVHRLTDSLILTDRPASANLITEMKADQPTPARIVITGAPASGKSEFLQKLKRHPSFEDFIFFDELARLLLRENPDFREDMGAFHREIYRRQIKRETEAADRPFITDRGTVDAFAFHPETTATVGTSIEIEYKRYNGVVLLGSSASLGEAHYRIDDIRRETIEDALAIETATKSVWSAHPQYRLIPARIDLEEKYQEFLAVIGSLAGRDIFRD